MSNKVQGNNRSSKIEEIAVEVPIENAPVAIEEKKEIKPIKKEEIKSIKKSIEKRKAKIILITRDGCIATALDGNKENVSFYGKKFLIMKIGDIIEF